MKRLLILSAIIYVWYYSWIAGAVATVAAIAWCWFRMERHGLYDEMITERYREYYESQKSTVMVDEDGEIDWERVKF